jgi:hypothetical protein
MMRKGIVGIGLIMAVLLGGTMVNWMVQWSTSMKSRADHQCTNTPDRILLVPGELFNPEKMNPTEPSVGHWTPGFEYVSCEELVGKK